MINYILIVAAILALAFWIYNVQKKNKKAPSLRPFFIYNGWLVRKRVELGNNDFTKIEKLDIVCDGFIGNVAFSGQYLGNQNNDKNYNRSIMNLSNYNNPAEYELNAKTK